MIWCVEDDPSIREIMVYALNTTGLDALGFEDGQVFWDALRETQPDLILLDVMLPGIDGIELLTRIKSTIGLREIPVIMATARGTEYEKIQGLDLGADDYLVKPFGMMEMVSRVKAVFRRCCPREDPSVLRLGELVLNQSERKVTLAGKQIVLTYKEYELLRLFLSNPGVAFTRENLLQRVWKTDCVTESRTVDMHIRTLRQKLGCYDSIIETIRGVGYRLRKTEHSWK